MLKKTEAAIWFYTGFALWTGACFLVWGATGVLALLGAFALVEGITRYANLRRLGKDIDRDN